MEGGASGAYCSGYGREVLTVAVGGTIGGGGTGGGGGGGGGGAAMCGGMYGKV